MSSADLGPIHGPRIPPQSPGQPDDCPGTLPLEEADQEQALPHTPPPVIEPPPVVRKPLGLDSPPVLPPQFPAAAEAESLADPQALGETTVAESQSRTQPRVLLADPMSAVDPAVIHIEANQDPNDVLSMQTVLRSARPWFVSCALNTLTVLLLALIPILVISEEEFLLELPPIEAPGEEYEVQVFDEAQLTEKEVDVSLPIVAPVEKLEEAAVQIAPLDLDSFGDPATHGVGNTHVRGDAQRSAAGKKRTAPGRLRRFRGDGTGGVSGSCLAPSPSRFGWDVESSRAAKHGRYKTSQIFPRWRNRKQMCGDRDGDARLSGLWADAPGWPQRAFSSGACRGPGGITAAARPRREFYETSTFPATVLYPGILYTGALRALCDE